jgi:heavy metal translocating P-type ATPase
MSTTADDDRCCAYCALPLLPARRVFQGKAESSSTDEPCYCCFGCRFAAAVRGAEDGASSGVLPRLALAVFLSMNVMAFTMALWSQDVYADPAGQMDPTAIVLRGLFRYLCLLFALPVLFVLGGPLLANALASLRQGIWNSDLLLVVGVVASYLYSSYSVLRDEGPVYYEVGCAVLITVTLGRWLEATGKMRAHAALNDLERLLPDHARVVTYGDSEQEIALAAVQVGDHLRVLPGERVPCDGRVMRQPITVDEQVLTGESRPAVKEVGDPAWGGSLNLDGEAFIEVTATSDAGTLARLIDQVRRARLSKGHYQRLADRLAGWFLPNAVACAIAATVWHTVFSGAEQGILAGLAVLLIVCPCALGLATPLAVWTALGQAARAGVVFRNGVALEKLAGIKAICLDKTGTLTTGEPAVSAFFAAASDREETVLGYAARLASASAHAYSQAIERFVSERMPGASGQLLGEIRSRPGRGMVATLPDGARVCLGSPRLMTETGLEWDPELENGFGRSESSLACVGWGGAVRGVFAFREEVRPEAVAAIESLRQLGLHVAVLTGDSAERGATLARELHVEVHAQLLPEDKVQQLAEARRRWGPVAMVGDGINDAPALVASDVGIALGCGTDLARDSASVCLLGNDLARLAWSIRLARGTVRTIRQNLFWAFIYNFVGVGFACTGRLNPVIAALAMVLSSLLVVTNSLRHSDRNVGPVGRDALCLPVIKKSTVHLEALT